MEEVLQTLCVDTLKVPVEILEDEITSLEKQIAELSGPSGRISQLSFRRDRLAALEPTMAKESSSMKSCERTMHQMCATAAEDMAALCSELGYVLSDLEAHGTALAELHQDDKSSRRMPPLLSQLPLDEFIAQGNIIHFRAQSCFGNFPAAFEHFWNSYNMSIFWFAHNTCTMYTDHCIHIPIRYKCMHTSEHTHAYEDPHPITFTRSYQEALKQSFYIITSFTTSKQEEQPRNPTPPSQIPSQIRSTNIANQRSQSSAEHFIHPSSLCHEIRKLAYVTSLTHTMLALAVQARSTRSMRARS